MTRFRIITRASVSLATLAALWAAGPASAFRTWNLPFITEALPSAALNSPLHWDLREFPGCQVPYAMSNAGMAGIDFNGDGNVNANDVTAASNAINAALTSWANVTPALIAPTRTPAAQVANIPGLIDGFNTIGFGTTMGFGSGNTDDVADPAPVGQNVGAANTPVIFAGADGILQSGGANLGGDDMMGMVGGHPVVHCGVNGVINTTPMGDDRWAIGINVGANRRIIAPGTNGTIETTPLGDDTIAGGFLNSGANGIVETTPNNRNLTNTSTFGVTGMLVNNTTGTIIESDIVLNTATMLRDETGVMRPVPWRTNGQRFNNPFNATNAAGTAGIGFTKDVQSTATHELGHSIGISHPEENQLVAVGQGPWGQPCISGAAGGMLSAATVGALMGDDEINGAGTMVYTGADGLCQTTAGGGDNQVIAVGSGAAGLFWAVLPASDNNLTTPRVPDDTSCADNQGNPFNAICVGPNGIANSGKAIGAIATMNTNPNCFTGNAAQERSLAQDDADACNFLYSWDLGDAPDPFMNGGPFNRYQTLVQSTTSGRMLNGVQLRATTALGPVHLRGARGGGGDDIVVGTGAGAMIRDGGNGIVETTPAGDDAWINANVPAAQRACGGIVTANANLISAGTNNVLNSTPNNCVNFLYEWLGANVDGNANEHSPLAPDNFDDGMTFVQVNPTPISGHGNGYKLNRGGAYAVTITISTSGLAGRYVGGAPSQELYFNGYYDFDGDRQFLLANDRVMNWWGSNIATTGASANLTGPATFQAGPNNTIVLNYTLNVPANAGGGSNVIYARMRLDYGEDEGRVNNISMNNGAATGVAQYGEVEDYAIMLCDPPDQLHVGCLPGYQFPSIPSGQAGTLQVWAERNFEGLEGQLVTITQIGGAGAFQWPDGSTSATNPSMTFTTNGDGRAQVQIFDTNNNPGDVFVEFAVVGTTLKAYCQFDIGFFGGVRSSDLNGDGVVDTADLGILLGQFGSVDPSSIADINNDGIVDTADLGVLLELFIN
ncbi:MAG: hypothetical protein H6814_08370 [Phycisphaeraceae bacterium]|nr:hypothetical protein [Phycisphaeraceae bacterium]